MRIKHSRDFTHTEVYIQAVNKHTNDVYIASAFKHFGLPVPDSDDPTEIAKSLNRLTEPDVIRQCLEFFRGPPTPPGYIPYNFFNDDLKTVIL
jgi:hypothetical protein